MLACEAYTALDLRNIGVQDPRASERWGTVAKNVLCQL